jgi:hypothetical protein
MFQLVCSRNSSNGGDSCRMWLCTARVSSKQTKKSLVRTKTNWNKICFGLFCETKTKNFGLFRCFEPISKQSKQTELFQNKTKQTETTLNFIKIRKYALYQTVSVGLLFVSAQSKHQNSLIQYRSETTKTNYFKTNQNKPKKTGKTLNFLKNTKICSISNCFGWSSDCLGLIETSKISVSV